MPVYPIERKGRGLQIARAGRRGGTFVQNLRYSAAQRWADSLKTRPNRLIPPRQGIPPGDYEADFEFGRQGDDAIPYQEGNPYQMNADEADVNLQNTFRRWRRPKAAARLATATNWLEAEKRMIAIRTSMERAVPCDCPTETIDARFISLEAYEVRAITLCKCGRRSSMFVEEGFFPSTPIKPRTFFSFKLLRILHEQAIRGGISKYAWAAGLRAVHEIYMAKTLPDFYELLLDAYHHFVAVENAVQAHTSEYLQVRQKATTGEENPWAEEDLANCCPACFDFSHYAGDRSVGITIDGNFQHLRFNDRGHSGVNHKKLEPRKFVSYGVRDFSTVDSVAVDDAGCENKFHATGGWGKTLNTSSKKHLDEAGLMGTTCFHGIPLRYLNIHGTGERQAHGAALLKHILDYDTDMNIRLCYDVSCVFVPALERLLPEDAHRVKGAIGRFHIYAHRYACHVLWSTLRLKGFGLMVGEEIEQHWYMLAHLIPSGRVTTGPRKMQKIDSCSLSITRIALERFGKNLERRWKKARKVEHQESAKLQQVLQQTVPERKDKGGRLHPRQRITIEYLDQQAADQVEYFTKYK
jgi:hypothetical protein